MKDAEHLIRLAGLFAVGVIAFIVIRAAMVPAGYGELGHYRTGAIQDNRDQTLIHAGRAACWECHDNRTANDAGNGHSGVGCEACHGALAAHAADPDSLTPTLPDPDELCANCHAIQSARPDWFPQIDVKEHAGGDSCVDCHDPHQPVIE